MEEEQQYPAEPDFEETQNSFEFETGLINPASEKSHDWLTRDMVLSNITKQQLMEIRAGLELVQLLDFLNLVDAKKAFLADIQALAINSRGVDGFWTKMMRTSISERTLKGFGQEEIQKRGFRWLFGKRKQ